MIATAALDEREVLYRMRDRIWRNGGRPAEWYVGVCPDPTQRLFREHGVRPLSDGWTYQLAETPEAATRVAHYLIHSLGAHGTGRIATEGPAYVYAFRKGPHTRKVTAKLEAV